MRQLLPLVRKIGLNHELVLQTLLRPNSSVQLQSLQALRSRIATRLLSSLRPWPGSARSVAATLDPGTQSQLQSRLQARGSGSSPDRYVMVPSL